MISQKYLNVGNAVLSILPSTGTGRCVQECINIKPFAGQPNAMERIFYISKWVSFILNILEHISIKISTRELWWIGHCFALLASPYFYRLILLHIANDRLLACSLAGKHV